LVALIFVATEHIKEENENIIYIEKLFSLNFVDVLPPFE